MTTNFWWDAGPIIFEFLNVKQLVASSSVCKMWKKIIDDPHIWTLLFKKKLKDSDLYETCEPKVRCIKLCQARSAWNNSKLRSVETFFGRIKRVNIFDARLSNNLVSKALEKNLMYSQTIGIYRKPSNLKAAAEHLANEWPFFRENPKKHPALLLLENNKTEPFNILLSSGLKLDQLMTCKCISKAIEKLNCSALNFLIKRNKSINNIKNASKVYIANKLINKITSDNQVTDEVLLTIKRLIWKSLYLPVNPLFHSIHFAAQKSYKITELMVHYMPKQIDLPDQEGLTPLHHAAKNNQVKTIELLVSNGANINKQTPHGYTPLHYAVECNHLKALKKLFSLGAIKDSPNQLGYTPFTFALMHKRTRFVEEFHKYGITESTDSFLGTLFNF